MSPLDGRLPSTGIQEVSPQSSALVGVFLLLLLHQSKEDFFSIHLSIILIMLITWHSQNMECPGYGPCSVSVCGDGI